MLHRMLKSSTVGKCCLTLLWTLAALLFLNIYNTPSIPPASRTPWATQDSSRHAIEFRTDPDRFHRAPHDPVVKYTSPSGSNPKGTLFSIAAPFTEARDKAQEARVLAARQKLALLFPSKRAAVDPLRGGSEHGVFYPGRVWRDTDGNTIQAHGGGILYVADTRMYYWYGEDKGGPTFHVGNREARVDVLGISCYSSKDLWAWKFEGTALSSEKTDKKSDLYITNVVERPKVLYNERSNKYIMWMHIDNGTYSKAAVGVAESTRPEGPFHYLGSTRPHGCDSRDMTVFKDDNGDAYIIYSSEMNSELHIGMLTENYTDVGGVTRVLVKQHREAPAVFKHHNVYYMVTSGCTGWNPNGALVHVAESLLGPWALGDPCTGADEEFRAHTFFSQPSFVLPLPGLPDTFLFMADRWRPVDLADSRYVWLLLTMGRPIVPLFDTQFNLNFPQCKHVSILWADKWKLPPGWNDAPHRQLQRKLDLFV